jgi:hypothetical protein
MIRWQPNAPTWAAIGSGHVGSSCGLEPRLKMRRFAIRAESRSVGKGSKVYVRENSRVSRSVRSEDFYLSSERELSRDAREFSAGDVTGRPYLHADPGYDPVLQHKRTGD